jgi:hypothetical protein
MKNHGCGRLHPPQPGAMGGVLPRSRRDHPHELGPEGIGVRSSAGRCPEPKCRGSPPARTLVDWLLGTGSTRSPNNAVRSGFYGYQKQHSILPPDDPIGILEGPVGDLPQVAGSIHCPFLPRTPVLWPAKSRNRIPPRSCLILHGTPKAKSGRTVSRWTAWFARYTEAGNTPSILSFLRLGASDLPAPACVPPERRKA